MKQVHTSGLLKRLIDEAPKDNVDLDWLLGHLQKRAFGLLLLILAIAILVPGLGIIASIAIAYPAVEMMLGRDRPSLPRYLTKRAIATQRFTKWSTRILSVLKAIERVSRSRWHTPHGATNRAVGLQVLLLTLSSIWPLPSCRRTGSCSPSRSPSAYSLWWSSESLSGPRPARSITCSETGSICHGDNAVPVHM